MKRLALACLLLLGLTTVRAELIELSRKSVMFWSEVTMNDDGSPIDDLAGYRVYKSTSPDLDETDWVLSTSTTIVRISQLGLVENTTYYLNVKAYDETDHKSLFSPDGPLQVQEVDKRPMAPRGLRVIVRVEVEVEVETGAK